MEMLVERLIQIGYFAGQAVVVVAALLILISFIFNLAMKSQHKAELEVEDLKLKYERLGKDLKTSSMSKKELKTLLKAEKKAKKKKEEPLPTVYVINFEGDMRAHAVDNLREEISAVLTAATDQDEVVVCIESPGGVVHGYGLAAAQLLRVKNRGIKLTACVDKVAASGGYLMACVADQIISAPFAIIGSIGVIAQVPNFHRLLKKHDIDYREITAGEFKRTVSLLGEITDKGEQKFLEQITETHQLFKEFVKTNRPQVDVTQIATGEYWYGNRAKELKLVDEIMTSDDFLLKNIADKNMKKISFQKKKKLSERLGLSAAKVASQTADLIWQKLESSKYL